MVYENARKALQSAFPGLKGQDISSYCKLTQSTYRFEQPLVVGSTLYQFPVLVNQEVFSNTEQRLLQQDSAVIYQVGIFAGAPASLADTAWIPDTYPNTIKYAGANGDALYSLWNGSNFSIAVNGDILMPNWDVMKHFNSPETQQTAALASASPGDQFRGGHDGFYPMEPNVVMIGSKNNVLQLTLKGTGITAVQAFSRAVIILRCITAQNSSVVS